MGRRETLARAIKLQQAKQRPPAIILLPDWGFGPQLVTWSMARRTPTREEIVATVIAAGYSRERAEAAAARSLHKQSINPEPGSTQPAEHEEE
jgi:hypothetical protein